MPTPSPSPKARSVNDAGDHPADGESSSTDPGIGSPSSAPVSRKKTSPSLGASPKLASPPRPDRTGPPGEPKPAESDPPESSNPPSTLRVREALAAKEKAESSLSGLHHAVEKAMSDSRLAAQTLAAELKRTREVVRMARRERDEAIATLESTRREHSRLLDEHDIFVANLIEEYEQRIAAAASGRASVEPSSIAPDTTPASSSDRPTVPHSIAGKPAPGDTGATQELDADHDRTRALEKELTALRQDVEKAARERERSRELLRRYLEQRDEAQIALGEVTDQRDDARAQLMELRARTIELQSQMDRLRGDDAPSRVAVTQPAPAGSTRPQSANAAPRNPDGVAVRPAHEEPAQPRDTPAQGRRAPKHASDPAPDLPADAPPYAKNPDRTRTAPDPAQVVVQAERVPSPPDPLASTLRQRPPRSFGPPARPSPPPVELEAAAVIPDQPGKRSPGTYSVSADDLEPERVEGAGLSSRPPRGTNKR